jgi:hypothetical protein
MCRKAHDYDRKVLKTLGARVLWVKSFADIPKVIRYAYAGRAQD